MPPKHIRWKMERGGQRLQTAEENSKAEPAPVLKTSVNLAGALTDWSLTCHYSLSTPASSWSNPHCWGDFNHLKSKTLNWWYRAEETKELKGQSLKTEMKVRSCNLFSAFSYGSFWCWLEIEYQKKQLISFVVIKINQKPERNRDTGKKKD